MIACSEYLEFRVTSSTVTYPHLSATIVCSAAYNANMSSLKIVLSILFHTVLKKI